MTAPSPKPSPRPSQNSEATDVARAAIEAAAAASKEPATPPLTKPLVAADDAAVRAPRQPTEPAAAEPSIGQLVATATESLSTLVRSEIELAKLELRSTVKNGVTGVGAFAGALVVVLFAVPMVLFAAAEGLAEALPRWLSFLIVFGAMLVLAGLLAVLGIKKVKKVRAPEKTIATTKETVDYLKSQRA